MKEVMKAVVVKNPMEFAVEEVPSPGVPDDGMLLDVVACGLCGSDLRTLRSGHRKVKFPWIIGHEICGIVKKTGSSYEGRWQVDDVVAVGPPAYCGECEFCMNGQYELCVNLREIGQVWPGGLAEKIAIPKACIKLGAIEKIPNDMDPVLATIAEPMSSCINAQEKGSVGLGDTVVIIGAGPIGCLHVCIALARGADKIIVADISEDRLKLSEVFGPNETINVSKVDLEKEVRSLTNGNGADIVITATPAPIAQVQAVEIAKKGGRILVFGGLPKDNCKPNIDMNIVHYNGLKIIGTTAFSPRDFSLSLKLIDKGNIPVDKLVTHRLPLSYFDKGVKLALEGKSLKMVFQP